MKLANLPVAEIEGELARRHPGLAADDLHRLINCARFKADISRISKYAPAELLGREAESKLLSDAWNQAVQGEPKRPHVITFVALGGEGKTSLVAKWAADLAHRDWPDCDIVFAWSFYSQGTREQTAASSDLFLREALLFFGDAAMAGSAAGAFDKGRRLAQLAGERRALLILDGIEPLQYAPTSPTPGELKDQGLAALLKGLAASSRGLCVVTTRYSLPDLKLFWRTTASEIKLDSLSRAAGVALLRSFGVKGSLLRNIPFNGGREQVNEFEKLVEDVKRHALTLNLLGSYLRDAHAGDIRKSGQVKLEEANAEEQGGHAFHVMDAYVQWLESGAKTAEDNAKGLRALAVLQLLGLFDRPASADCLKALWTGEAIAGLTEPVAGWSEAQRNITLTRLEEAKLLTVSRAKGSGELLVLDAHPLLREYFARRVREGQPEAWRAAHRLLYEHLCATTKEGDQPALEDLQPLYQAIAHGCQAGLQQKACEEVYDARIERRDEHYSLNKLGAFGSDLGAAACFFDSPWTRVSPAVTVAAQAWLLGEAAFCLRALGRLAEALEPMRAGLEMNVKHEYWKNAARIASNLSELELTLGEVAGAVEDAKQSVTYADRSGETFGQMAWRTTHAVALHQTGRWAEAEMLFREAEQMQAERQPGYPLLYSIRGFRYCDLLLAAAERIAWQICLESEGILPAISSIKPEASSDMSPVALDSLVDAASKSSAQNAHRSGQDDRASLIESCRAVSQRGKKMFEWQVSGDPLLDIALDHLTLGRVALCATVLESGSGILPLNRDEQQRLEAAATLNAAVTGLRRAGMQDYLPHGLLTRAWLRFLEGARTGPESAQSDLDEAWEIAERGPMRLFLADIHLHRARLFCRETPYPWNQNPDGTPRGPADDLAAARHLIEKHSYWRRKEELEDAEEASKSW